MYRDENSPITLGLEFESVIRTRADIIRAMEDETSDRVKRYYHHITRDASVESSVVSIGNNSAIFMGSSILRKTLRRKEQTVTGYEIVTHPLEMEVMRQVILKTINLQVRMGEIFSERSSIHVHAGFPAGLIFTKAAVALGLKVEPLLYKLAGMGNTFRGVTNNAAYCRPLALPPAVKLADTEKLAVLSPLSASEAVTRPEFWGYFGIRYGDTERYNPLRYMGINVYSTTLKGTMEYRFFNFCTIPSYVEAVARLCQLLTDLMIRLPQPTIKGIHQMSIFQRNSDSEYKSLLKEIIRLGDHYESEFKLEDRDTVALMEIIDRTPQPVFVEKDILSHVQSPRITLDDATKFGLRIINKADNPGIVDIHNFSSQDRKLMGDLCAN